MTLELAFREAKGAPYQRPITAVVCGVAPVVKYKKENGEEKEMVTIGLADRTTAVKCLLYDTSKLNNLREGLTVMILNSITKSMPQKTVVITKQTRVMRTREMDIPDTVRRQGKDIACPPVQELTLSEVKTSPTKTMCSVQAQVAAAEMPRFVLVKNEQTQIKEIHLKSGPEKCKLTLWREHSELSINVGSWIKAENLTTQMYKDDVSLSTTSRSVIQFIDTPEEEVEGQIVAFSRTDADMLELVLAVEEDYPTYICRSDILTAALTCDNEQEMEDKLAVNLPMEVLGRVQNGHITTLRKKEMEQ